MESRENGSATYELITWVAEAVPTPATARSWLVCGRRCAVADYCSERDVSTGPDEGVAVPIPIRLHCWNGDPKMESRVRLPREPTGTLSYTSYINCGHSLDKL